MIIGIPKKIKNNENRVALTPAGARELVKRGHTVYVQHTAGELTLAMMERGAVCLSYETVENPDATLPLLIPMSEKVILSSFR